LEAGCEVKHILTNSFLIVLFQFVSALFNL
jgi:hypothetical protein